MRDDDAPTEREALAMGLAITSSNWDGDNDFCRGMRLLQEHLFGKQRSTDHGTGCLQGSWNRDAEPSK